MSYNLFSHDSNGTIGLVFLDSGTFTLYNNVIYSGAQVGTGLYVSGATAVVVAKNNIISGFDVGFSKVAGDVTEDYNLVYGASTANWSGLVAGSHSLSVDPRFTDAALRDFTLQSSSPAIDAGIDVGLTQDFAGGMVPQGAAPDMGAYEHGALLTSQPSSVSSTSAHVTASACGDMKPELAPKLFQIDVIDDKATLYFVPSYRTSYYFISYGYSPGDERFGAQFEERATDGAIPYTINYLEAGKTYYFKVRGGNGCMPGDWSNTLRATVPANGIAGDLQIFTAWEQMRAVVLSWL